MKFIIAWKTTPVLISSLLLTATQARKMKTFDGTGFSVEGNLELDESLGGGDNADIIGAHLHTGMANVNGPVNIIFCGGSPLPEVLAINGPCSNSDEWESPTSMGGWANGANNDTAVELVNLLPLGAPTTPEEFMSALDICSSISCEVYFNIHTAYSFAQNPGAGLARGKLEPTDCPSTKPVGAKCWTGDINSANTNDVPAVTNKLPSNAGSVTDLLVTYIGDEKKPKKGNKKGKNEKKKNK